MSQKLEANDTIVSLGNYRLLVPLSTTCDWVLQETLNGVSELGDEVGFNGCGPLSYSVVTRAFLTTGIDEYRQDDQQSFEFAMNSIINADCRIQRIDEDVVGNKHWILCKGPNGEVDFIYNLHVIFRGKEFYCDLH